MNNYGDVVVGADGSRGAAHAVEFAAFQAAVHHATLRIVCSWSSSGSPMVAMTPVLVPDIAAERERIALDRVEQARAIAEGVAPELDVVTQAIEGSAGQVLCETSRNSRLLVVGSRGHSGMQGLLLGSVSHYCLLHASCPVLVIPAGLDERPPTVP